MGPPFRLPTTTFTGFSRGDFLGIPNLFWMVVAVAVLVYIFLHRSRYGRYLFAIGSNTEAGIQVLTSSMRAMLTNS